MRKTGWILLLLAAIVPAVGCEQNNGTTRTLGPLEYASTFDTAQKVFSQYFSIETADPATGEIIARPKRVDAPNERILGGSPARQIATMKIFRQGDQVAAYVSIEQQRMGSFVRGGNSSFSRDDDLENGGHRTPAQNEGATTPQQNENWQTERQMHAMELRVLSELARNLQSLAPPAQTSDENPTPVVDPPPAKE